MTIDELEMEIGRLRTRPLMIVCRIPNGTEAVMSVRECVETGGRFLHVAADDLDKLLERELGGGE